MGAASARVGIIGANPHRGWGSGVHRRVIAALPELELAAVCTTRMDSAREAAAAFGAAHAFEDPLALIAHPDVEIVAICVLAPHHHALALAALAAGKRVYCEWPLGLDEAQGAEMASAAIRSGCATMIGLHMRGLPALRHARALIADGYVGDVLAANLVMRRPGFPSPTPAALLAMASRDKGTTTQSIHLGHLMDALRFTVGEPARLRADGFNHAPVLTVAETGEAVEKEAADQIIVQGRLAGGGAFAVDVASLGVDGFTDLRVTGSRGTLQLRTRPGAAGAFAAFEISGSRASGPSVPLVVPAEYDVPEFPADLAPVMAYPGVQVPAETLAATAILYRTLAGTIGHDAPPDFTVGLGVMRMLADIDGAIRSGHLVDVRQAPLPPVTSAA